MRGPTTDGMYGCDEGTISGTRPDSMYEDIAGSMRGSMHGGKVIAVIFLIIGAALFCHEDGRADGKDTLQVTQ